MGAIDAVRAPTAGGPCDLVLVLKLGCKTARDILATQAFSFEEGTSLGASLMLKHVRHAVIALALFSLLVTPAYAWNDFGHMTIAYLAYQKLTPAARERANALLRLNPYHDRWAAAVPEGLDKDMVIFMLASLWPDEIKGDSNYVSDGTAGGNRPDGSPDASRNTGYDDNLMHKYRHFIDRPFSMDSTPVESFQIPTPNAQDSIALFRSVLSSSEPDGKKSYDLTWLLHLVGDIHQPLHATTRLSTALPNGDDGGNRVKLHCRDCPPNLHAFWDDELGKTNRMQTPPQLKGLPDADSIRAIIQFAKKLHGPKRAFAAKSSEAVWVQESFDAAQKTVYSGLIAGSDGTFSVTPSYAKSAKKLARQRAVLAGARLANLINSELK